MKGLVGARLLCLLHQLRHVLVNGTRGTDVNALFARRRPQLRPRGGGEGHPFDVELSLRSWFNGEG